MGITRIAHAASDYPDSLPGTAPWQGESAALSGVELTSFQELGQVKLVPRKGAGEKLTEYFHKLFHTGTQRSGERWVTTFRRAVLDGKAAVAVQPRGDVETQRAS